MGGNISSEYYVSTNGKDLNPGSQGLPFKTIGKACASLPTRPNDRLGQLPAGGVTIWVRGGTYRETVRPPATATADRPIRFVAYPGEEPIVSGADVLNVPWTLYSGKIYKAATAV